MFHVEQMLQPSSSPIVHPEVQMNRWTLPLLLLTLWISLPLMAAPRDAISALNRCGDPMQGDSTILENTVAGGRRILTYERGSLHFDKMGNDGWTFSYGTHGKLDHLNAKQMEEYMPCLKESLADSASPAPLVMLTRMQRAETSDRSMYKTLSVYGLAFLVTVCAVLVAFSRRSKAAEGRL